MKYMPNRETVNGGRGMHLWWHKLKKTLIIFSAPLWYLVLNCWQFSPEKTSFNTDLPLSNKFRKCRTNDFYFQDT